MIVIVSRFHNLNDNLNGMCSSAEPKTIMYLSYLASINENLRKIHFPLCLSQHFQSIFRPERSEGLKNLSCVEKYVENFSTNTRESELSDYNALLHCYINLTST